MSDFETVPVGTLARIDALEKRQSNTETALVGLLVLIEGRNLEGAMEMMRDYFEVNEDLRGFKQGGFIAR